MSTDVDMLGRFKILLSPDNDDIFRFLSFSSLTVKTHCSHSGRVICELNPQINCISFTAVKDRDTIILKLIKCFYVHLCPHTNTSVHYLCLPMLNITSDINNFQVNKKIKLIQKAVNPANNRDHCLLTQPSTSYLILKPISPNSTMLGTILKLCEQTSQRSTVSNKQQMQMVTAESTIPGNFKITIYFIRATTPVTTTNEPIIPNTKEPIKVSIEIASFEKRTLNSNDPNISSGFQVTIFMDNSNYSEDIRINYVTVEIPGTNEIKTIHNFSNPETENMSFLVFRYSDRISLWPIKFRKVMQDTVVTTNQTNQTNEPDQTEQSVQPGPSGQSVQPRKSGQSVQPGPSRQSVQPRQLGQFVQPGLSGQTVQPRQSSQSVQSAPSGQSVQPGQSIQPGPSVKSVQPRQSSQSVQPGPSGQSIQPRQSGQTVQPGPSGQSIQPGQSLLKPILHPNNLDTSCAHETTRMYVQSQTPIDMPSTSYIVPNAIKTNTIICKRCLSMSQRSDATRRPKKQRVNTTETMTSNNITITSHSSNLHSLPATTSSVPTLFDMSLNTVEHIDINNRTIMGPSDNISPAPLTTQSVPIIFDSPLNIVEERNIGSTWQLDDPGESLVCLDDSFMDDSNYASYLTEDDKYDSFAEQLND